MSSPSKDTVKPITEILGMTAREIEVAVKGWSCVSGEFKVDYNKLHKLGNFSSAKTAANQWRITKKKLDALALVDNSADSTAAAASPAPKRKLSAAMENETDGADNENENNAATAALGVDASAAPKRKSVAKKKKKMEDGADKPAAKRAGRGKKAPEEDKETLAVKPEGSEIGENEIVAVEEVVKVAKKRGRPAAKKAEEGKDKVVKAEEADKENQSVEYKGAAIGAAEEVEAPKKRGRPAKKVVEAVVPPAEVEAET